LSFQCAIYSIDTTRGCQRWLRSDIVVLALPLHHRDLDSVGVLTKDHLAILVAWPLVRGAYLRDKNTCARTSTEI